MLKVTANEKQHYYHKNHHKSSSNSVDFITPYLGNSKIINTQSIYNGIIFRKYLFNKQNQLPPPFLQVNNKISNINVFDL